MVSTLISIVVEPIRARVAYEITPLPEEELAKDYRKFAITENDDDDDDDTHKTPKKKKK